MSKGGLAASIALVLAAFAIPTTAFAINAAQQQKAAAARSGYPTRLSGKVSVVASATAASLLPISGPPPSSGQTDTYDVPFTVELENSSTAAPISGASITVTLYSGSTAIASTTVTTTSGAAAGSFNNVTLTAGTAYTLTAVFSGASIGGTPYDPSQASQSFNVAYGTPTTLILSYTGG